MLHAKAAAVAAALNQSDDSAGDEELESGSDEAGDEESGLDQLENLEEGDDEEGVEEDDDDEEEGGDDEEEEDDDEEEEEDGGSVDDLSDASEGISENGSKGNDEDGAGSFDNEGDDDDEPVGTDGFFRWQEMEGLADEFERAQALEEEALNRRQKEKRRSGRAESDDDDDEDIEFLDDGDNDEDDGDDWKYDDFFAAPKKSGKTASLESAKPAKPARLTKHEQKQAKLRQRIEELEEAAMEKKAWNLQGEVGGKKRPENSLLEVDAEWDTTSRAVPEVTVERTTSIEDMIKQRVLDERWDSVMPKRAPVASGGSSEGAELSQEKSTMGLGEVYEKEYLHQALGVARDDENAGTRDEAKALFAKVCRKIDALSNFSFAPRPSVPDMKVAPAVAAISMEEVLPMGVSQVDAQAPEEVHGKKRGREGLVRGSDEVDKEDRKRMRGAKKSARRKERRADEAEAKLASRINPGLGNPYEKRKLVESLRGARNVATGDQVKLEADQKTHTSSAKFFAGLAEEQAQTKTGVPKKNP